MDSDIIGVALGVAIIILASGVARYWMPAWASQNIKRQNRTDQPEPQPQSARQFAQSPQITAKALETYERLAKDKLEVIKTALAMGYKDSDLAELDARLEKLVGKDALTAILHGSGAETLASADLVDTQLEREVDRLRALRNVQR